MRIISWRVNRVVDESPDVSWLGEYSSRPGAADRTIDREARGDAGRSEHLYWVAANGVKETGNPASVEEDYQRMESLNRGDWCFIGIMAKARVQLTEQGPIQEITSGGLWGIESDSGEEYLKEVEAEQIYELRDQLLALGFTAYTLDEALPAMAAAK